MTTRVNTLMTTGAQLDSSLTLAYPCKIRFVLIAGRASCLNAQRLGVRLLPAWEMTSDNYVPCLPLERLPPKHGGVVTELRQWHQGGVVTELLQSHQVGFVTDLHQSAMPALKQELSASSDAFYHCWKAAPRSCNLLCGIFVLPVGKEE